MADSVGFKMGPCGVRERKVDLGIAVRDAKRQFIKPVPLEWARRTWSLPGKALAVGQAIWYRAGVKKSETVVLPYSELRSAGMSARTVRRSLEVLESAGLVSVQRNRGRSPIVTIIDADERSQTP